MSVKTVAVVVIAVVVPLVGATSGPLFNRHPGVQRIRLNPELKGYTDPSTLHIVREDSAPSRARSQTPAPHR